MPYFYSIQLLRFICATLIILGHMYIWEHSYKGMDMLFVISGFVIFLTSYKKYGAGLKPGISFLKRRLIRIFAFYWLFFFGLIIPGIYKVTIDFNLFKSIFLFPGHKSFLLVTWSLSYELYFYILITLLISFSKYRKSTLYIYFFWIITFLLLLLQWSDYSIKNTPVNFFLGQNIWLIISGCVSAMIYLKMRKMTASKNLMLSTILLISGLFLFFCYVNYYSTLSFLLTGTGSSMIIIAIVNFEKVKRTIIPDIFIRLGNASYVAYLIHIPILHCLSEYLEPWLIFQIMLIVLIWICSIFIHEWIEKPLIKKLNKYL